MTAEERAAAWARCNAATAGPWVSMKGFVRGPDNEPWVLHKPDRDFIAHARTDLPAALAGLNAADEKIARLRALLGQCEEWLRVAQHQGGNAGDCHGCAQFFGAGCADDCGYAATLAAIDGVSLPKVE